MNPKPPPVILEPFGGSGDPTQQDCTGSIGRRAQEKGSGALLPSTHPPAPMSRTPRCRAAASFYETDTRGNNTPSETGLATANSNGGGPAQGTDGLTAMLQRMEALG
jgi:hypothetical protein